MDEMAQDPTEHDIILDPGSVREQYLLEPSKDPNIAYKRTKLESS